MKNPKPLMPGGALVVVDPSVASPGAALFYNGELRWAGYIKIPKDDRATLERCAIAGRDVVDLAIEALHGVVEAGTLSFQSAVVVEAQEHYAGSRVNVNDLLKLAAMAGAATLRAVEQLAALQAVFLPAPHVLSPRPREWCGTLPKSKSGSYWKSPRGARVRSRLSAEELALVPDQPDAGDAVGLGLWGLGKFAPLRKWR